MPVSLGPGLGLTDIPVLGGAAVIDPSDVAGLITNFDAQVLSSITKDGSDRVSDWADLSSNGLDAAQANGVFQPLYVADGMNGKPCIDFTGSRGMAAVDAAAMNHTGMTLLVVGMATADDGINQHELFRKWSGASNREFRGFCHNAGNTVQFGFTTAGTGGIFGIPATYGWVVDTPFLLTVRDDGVNTETLVNDTDTDTDVGTIWNSTADLILGLAGGSTDVALGQFIWYNNDISDEDYNALVAMLLTKWGIA